MENFEALRLLSIKTNRIILSVLDEPKTSMEVFKEIKNKSEVKNRESVYKALEKLKKVSLVEKNYNDKENTLYYRRKYNKIIINLKKMKINFI